MPIQSADIDAASTDAFDFASNSEVYTIKAGVTVQSDALGKSSVDSNGHADVAVNNYGNIVSANNGVHIDATFAQIVNYLGASIAGYYGLNLGSSYGAVENQGTITGHAEGISDNGSTSIENSGNIFGYYEGINSAGADEHISNSGTIAGIGDGLAIGIQLNFTTAAGQFAYIDNTGLVRGNNASILSSGAGAVTLRNTGTLDGGAYLTNTGGIAFRNEGVIDGKITLGNAANDFDGRGGSIATGYIQGGTKVDTIHLGNDGETVNAGAGHDTIYGGNGNDTFAFSSYASANSDTIFGFNVIHDVVQLNHAQFTKLTAGATPAFSIGSAATSAHDYLFYNSGSGNLFYDPDGSGAGHADLIAKLDPGLKMTAHDFKVI